MKRDQSSADPPADIAAFKLTLACLLTALIVTTVLQAPASVTSRLWGRNSAIGALWPQRWNFFDDVGATELKVLEAADDALGLIEKIRNQDDHAPLGQRLRELMERLGDVRLAP